MKLVVVIQGPLITYGQGPNNTKEGFNTHDTIINNIERLGEFGLSYILSTWTPSSEQEKDIVQKLENANVCLIKNSTPEVFDPDHRYKQHYGILRGCEALFELNDDVTHIVKIRTDMLMPHKFWAWAVKVCFQDEKKLYVSELMYNPYYQGDFIYLAKTEVLFKFLTTVVNYKSRIIHPSIAFDMGLKNCEAWNFGVHYGSGLIGRIKFFIDFSLREEFVRNNWHAFINKYIGVMPKSIWLKIKWRNREIESFLDGSFFKFDNEEILKDNNYSSGLIKLVKEYKIYWTKCIKNLITKK